MILKSSFNAQITFVDHCGDYKKTFTDYGREVSISMTCNVADGDKCCHHDEILAEKRKISICIKHFRPLLKVQGKIGICNILVCIPTVNI